jgi:hypothetical protein
MNWYSGTKLPNNANFGAAQDMDLQPQAAKRLDEETDRTLFAAYAAG